MKLSLSIERVTFLAGLIIASLLFWQSVDLDAWSILGPGPGLFPQITTGACVVVAALLVLFPGLAKSATDREGEPDEPMGAEERRSFIAYAIALPFLAIAAIWLGFFGTSVIMVMGLTWLAEGKNWKPALLYAVLCGLIGVIGFGHYLQASLPTTAVDEFLLRLVR